MDWFGGALRDGNRFVEMLIGQAASTVAGARYLENAIDRVDAQAVAALAALADDASERRRVLIDELHKTFVTPLDREDLFNLSHCYEDVVTYALTTLEEMQILGVGADDWIRQMVALVREEAQELELAVRRLPQNPRVAGDHAHAARAKERDVERVYRAAIKALFAQATDPARLPALFYRREVYRHISNMSDRADSAANVLGMVVMKLA